MGKLTENKVLTSSRASSLKSVKNLNCWGSDIDDISILRQMPNLEVLSLSVNNINTLKDMKYCPKLKEIYLRKNNLSDISELVYLKHLPQLRVLWLSENPCTDVKCYRSTVLRNLPNLLKLDNEDIEEGEKRLAEMEGEELEVCPSDLPDFSELDLSVTLQEDDLSRFMKTSAYKKLSDEQQHDASSTQKKIDLDTINEKRTKLGLKPLDVDYASSAATTTGSKLGSFARNTKSNACSAIMLLLNDLDAEELRSVVTRAEELMQTTENAEEKEALFD